MIAGDAGQGHGFDPLRSGETLLRIIDGASSATLVAPFITVAGLAPVLERLDPSAEISIYTRWIPAEVAAGVSDPAVYFLVTERGGAIFLEPRLHAKAYITNKGTVVGSANLTARALGFAEFANLEILEPVVTPSLALDALLAVLTRTAAKATEATVQSVLNAAADVPPSHYVEARPVEPWLPWHPVPDQVCAAYLGLHPPVDPALLAYDLQAIDAPPGLSHMQFIAHVSALLRQGVAGRVYTDCQRQPTYVAISRFVSLAGDAGLPTPELPEARNARWVTMVEWFSHFLGATKTLGGRGFS